MKNDAWKTNFCAVPFNELTLQQMFSYHFYYGNVEREIKNTGKKMIVLFSFCIIDSEHLSIWLVQEAPHDNLHKYMCQAEIDGSEIGIVTNGKWNIT